MLLAEVREECHWEGRSGWVLYIVVWRYGVIAVRLDGLWLGTEPAFALRCRSISPCRL